MHFEPRSPFTLISPALVAVMRVSSSRNRTHGVKVSLSNCVAVRVDRSKSDRVPTSDEAAIIRLLGDAARPKNCKVHWNTTTQSHNRSQTLLERGKRATFWTFAKGAFLKDSFVLSGSSSGVIFFQSPWISTTCSRKGRNRANGKGGQKLFVHRI